MADSQFITKEVSEKYLADYQKFSFKKYYGSIRVDFFSEISFKSFVGAFAYFFLFLSFWRLTTYFSPLFLHYILVMDIQEEAEYPGGSGAGGREGGGGERRGRGRKKIEKCGECLGCIQKKNASSLWRGRWRN